MFFALSRKLFSSALFVAAVVTVRAQDPQHASQTSRDRIEQVMRSVARGRSVSQVAVSPDGKRLAWIEGAPGGTEIHLAPRTDLSKYVRVTAATSPADHCQENELTWSPDSAS